MQAIQVMSALAQPTRLEVCTQLARARPDGLSAGALAKVIGTPANTMSVHLAILTRAGIISSEKAGRNVVFKADPDAIRDLALFLMHDCCLGCADVTDPKLDEMQCCCGDRVRDVIGPRDIPSPAAAPTEGS